MLQKSCYVHLAQLDGCKTKVLAIARVQPAQVADEAPAKSVEGRLGCELGRGFRESEPEFAICFISMFSGKLSSFGGKQRESESGGGTWPFLLIVQQSGDQEVVMHPEDVA